jgi:hypothetical protein
MGKITVKNGTPMHGDSLCKTCTHSHWQKGFRESEEVVFCNWAFDAFRRVTFAVAECSHYTDTRIPSMDAMEDMATILGQSRRIAGFAKDEEDDRVPVVARR